MKQQNFFPTYASASPARIPDGQGVASLAFSLGAPEGGEHSAMPTGCNVQLLPDGVFAATDGRPGNMDGVACAEWLLDASSAASLAATVKERKTPFVIDYEHQTIYAKNNGQPAPAAGFFSTLTYVPGSGLFTCATWTEKAKRHIRDGEYLYISPVFTFCRKTGAVTGLLHAALTNTPALDGMAAAVAASALYTTINPSEAPCMTNQLLTAMIPLLGLAANATEAEATAKLAELQAVLKSNGGSAAPNLFTLAQNAGTKKDEADPAVPMSAVAGMQQQIAALTGEIAALRAGNAQQEADGKIAAALADGRLPKSLEDWARGLARNNPQALNQYLASAKPIAALSGMQTANMQGKDKAPGTPAVALTDEEKYAAAQLGMSHKEYAAYKTKED